MWEIILTDFSTYFKATVIKTCITREGIDTYINVTETTEKSSHKTNMAIWFLTKVQKLFNGEKIAFSPNGIGRTGCPYAETTTKDFESNLI